MSRLEHQASVIMKAMYVSINNDNFDNISGDTDRVSGAVDNDCDTNDHDKDERVMPYDKDEHVMLYDKDEHVMPYDKDEHEMPHDSDNEDTLDDNDNDQMPAKYANDYETVSDKAKHDKNIKSYEPNDVGKKDVVIYKRVKCIPTKEKRPIETRDIDDDFMREYDEMYKSMEYGYRNRERLKCNGILYYKLSLKYYKNSPLLALQLQHVGKHAPLSLLTP